MVTKEALYQIYKTSGYGLGGLFVILLIVMFLLYGKVSLGIMASGFVLHIVILSARVYAFYLFRKKSDTIVDTESVGKWLNIFRVGAFMTGLAWGSALFFLPGLPSEYHFLIYAILVGLAASGTVTLGVIPSIYYAFMLSILGGSLSWMLLQDGLIYSISALLTAILIFYYYFSARRFSINFNRAFLEKITIEDYVQKIEREHSALKQSEQLNNILKERMELALVGSNTSILDWDFTDDSFYISPNWKEMLGYDDSELSNSFLTWMKLAHRDDKRAIIHSLNIARAEKITHFENNHRLRHKNGHWVWVLGRAQILYDKSGEAVRMIGTHTDITEEKEMQLRFAQQAQILEHIHDAVTSTDLEGFVTSWNKGAEVLLGYTADEIIGRHISVVHPKEEYDVYKNGIDALLQKGEYRADTRLVKKSGTVIYANLSLSLLKDEKGRPVGMIGYAQDITERKRAEEKLLEQKNTLDYQAHHDVLTSLPNRVLFNTRLEQGIEKAQHDNTGLALLFIDLDHFKQINDSLGHEIGDRVLKVVTRRLKARIRKDDTLSRLGGDEFTIIMQEPACAQSSSQMARKILNALSEPIRIDTHTLYVSSSIGISLYPQDGEDAHNLIKYADTAMYKAKDEGRNNYQFYSAEMTELAFERIAMEASLRQALKNNEFVVHYQPQVDAKQEKIIGVEALVRWQHPILGLSSPEKFIPLAEETGLIVEIDRIVMKEAMRQVCEWYEEGLNPGVLSLNLAVKQLEHNDFLQTLQSNMERSGFKPEWLEFEVAEGQVMQKPEEAIAKLRQISDFGIGIAIDDFGTGYSSLSYLKRLPINKLKIDRSFVRDVPDDDEDVAIVKAIIALARSLNLDLVGEGVETAAQKEFLIENGCRNIQGYYYSRPMPPDKMKAYMQSSG